MKKEADNGDPELKVFFHPPCAIARQTMSEVTIGKTDGNYFTQWRIDLLSEFFALLKEFNVELREAVVWYDKQDDFHRLSFVAGNRTFNVRFYKVFSVAVNGSDRWIGVLKSSMTRLAVAIAQDIHTEAKE